MMKGFALSIMQRFLCSECFSTPEGTSTFVIYFIVIFCLCLLKMHVLVHVVLQWNPCPRFWQTEQPPAASGGSSTEGSPFGGTWWK